MARTTNVKTSDRRGIGKMIILGIDPGSRQSGMILWDHEHGKVLELAVVENEGLILWINNQEAETILAIEQIRGYGIVAGDDTFDTCWWSGRFFQAGCRLKPMMIPRKEIKRHLCGNTTTNDKYVRQALIDRYGEQGTKKVPGPLWGVSGHVWSALATAVTAGDQLCKTETK